MHALLVTFALAGSPDDKTSWNDLAWGSAPPSGATCQPGPVGLTICTRSSTNATTSLMAERLIYGSAGLMGARLSMPFSTERMGYFKKDLTQRYGAVTNEVTGGWGWNGTKVTIILVKDSRDDEVHIIYYYNPLSMAHRKAFGSISGGL